MTDTTINLLIATIVPTLTGVGAIIAALRAGDKADRTSRMVDDNTKTTESTHHKADTIIEKASEIHALTNSNLSKVTAALEVANTKIAGLERLMAEMMSAKLEAKSADIAHREENL